MDARQVAVEQRGPSTSEANNLLRHRFKATPTNLFEALKERRRKSIAYEHGTNF